MRDGKEKREKKLASKLRKREARERIPRVRAFFCDTFDGRSERGTVLSLSVYKCYFLIIMLVFLSLVVGKVAG